MGGSFFFLQSKCFFLFFLSLRQRSFSGKHWNNLVGANMGIESAIHRYSQNIFLDIYGCCKGPGCKILVLTGHDIYHVCRPLTLISTALHGLHYTALSALHCTALNLFLYGEVLTIQIIIHFY